MQKMKKGNIIIEVMEQDIEKAEKLGFEIYNGYLGTKADQSNSSFDHHKFLTLNVNKY